MSTLSEVNKGQFTTPHQKALAVLCAHHIAFKAEEVIHCWGERDGKDRPVSYKVDFAIVQNEKYHDGILEIEGAGTNSADPKRDHRLLGVGFKWVEHCPNADAKNVMKYLEKHRRKVDDYGGVV